jgi:hypothetical protein
MDARQYLSECGRDAARRVAEEAGTNLAYFEQIACGARAPSLKLADRLTAASRGALDVMSLLRAKEIAAARRRRQQATSGQAA